MERRESEETAEISTSNQPNLMGTMALRNFTIPKKKWISGKVILEPCPEDSRDYSLIQSKLRESRLNMRKDQANTWLWKDIRLVHNEELLRKFSEKRAEMRAKGRHGREMEERFCFLVASDQVMTQIYQHGLKVGNTVQHALGKPSYGVYLFRHVDVALKSTTSTLSAKNLLIFKVLYGKVKKIAPSLDWNKTQDPTISFDCHMFKDSVSYQDSLHLQVLGSSVFLFDFNENQELIEKPRQCLPYAVVSFVPASSVILTAHVNLPPLSIMLPVGPMHDCFKACTVAERRGKGDTATVTFKHFGTTSCFVPDYTAQNPGVEAVFQKTDMHNTWIAASPDSGSSSSSMLNMNHSANSQSLLEKEAFLSGQKQNMANANETYDNKCDTIPQSSLDKISTVVYSSRLVRDPRLSKQETKQQTNCSETPFTPSGCNDKKCQPVPQNQEAETDSCPNEQMDMNEAQRNMGCSLKSSVNDQCVHIPKQKAETLPSMKLFKMKFQKYAAYFRLNEEERHQRIWSLENMSPEQKQALIDRINFYEVYYHKYKKGLLSHKVKETEKASSLRTKENLQSTTEIMVSQKKENLFHVSQPKSHNDARLSDTTDCVFRKKCIRNIGNTDIHQIKHSDNPESNELILREKEKNLLPEIHRNYVDHPNECLVQSSGKLTASLNLNITEKKADLQIVQYGFKQPVLLTCPPINCQSQLSSAVDVNESALDVNLVERPSLESSPVCPNNIISMDIASCVDVSSCEMSKNCNMNPAIAVRQEQDRQSNVQERVFFLQAKCSENSRISSELDMVTLQEDKSIHWELYKRLQFDELLANKKEKHILFSRAYLTSRGLASSTDNIFKQVTESKEPSKTETQNMRCWEDINLKVTLKANSCPTHTTGGLSLSERFSKLKGLQRKVTTLVNGTNFSNCKIINPGTQIFNSDEYKKSGFHNGKLIQLLAQRYNMAKLHAKCRSLSKSKRKDACIQKRYTALLLAHSKRRRKYVKNRNCWKAKKNLGTIMVSTESYHNDGQSRVTLDSNSLAHTSEIVFTESKDREPDTSSRIICQTSDAESDRQQLHIQGCQETNAKNLLQDLCEPNIPVINKDLTPPLGFKTIAGTKEEQNIKKPIEDTPNNLIPVMLDKVEQKKTNKNSLDQNKTSLGICACISESSKDYGSTITECREGSLLQKMTSEIESEPLGREESDTLKMLVAGNMEGSDSLSQHDCEVSEMHSNMTLSDVISGHTTKLQTNMTPESKVTHYINDKVETENDVDVCDNVVDDIENEINPSMKSTLNVHSFDSRGVMASKVCSHNIPNKNQPCLTSTNNQGEVLFKEQQLDSKQANNILDLTVDDPGLSEQSEIASENVESNNTMKPLQSKNLLHATISNTKHASTVKAKENCRLPRPEELKNYSANSAETQLISKLRDYLAKFESTVKKQELVNEDINKRPVAWVTLDSTAHKQQLVETGQYSIVNFPCLMPQGSNTITKGNSSNYTETSAQTRNIPGSDHFQTGPDISLLVPAELKRGRRSLQNKGSDRHQARRGRNLVSSVSPDSKGALDTVMDNTSPYPLAQMNNRIDAPTEIPINTSNTQFQLKSKNKIRQQNPIRSHNTNSLCELKSQVNQSSDTIEIIDDEDVSSTYAQSDYNIRDISNTLKFADQATLLTELESLESKCRCMLQHFISRFEKDQKVPFNQSFVSRGLILEQYLDYPPTQVDLKYEAVNSYLELQMMLEAWQFVENKINFLRGKPTFRSLLWYDSSLYGELYKGKLGFQQQSSLFPSFQNCLAQEGYNKLQEYYIAVSTLHQQLHVTPDTSYYMYLKSKRELFEAEAAVRNPHEIKSFFLSVPMAAMINFGDTVERLEKVHKVIMAFVETPSDKLPGTFDVGKAEHLSITCRYLQEKAFYIRSYKDMISKVSWFGIEHLLYDASKVLVWQNHGVPNEALNTYKSSNPQIIFGVTESSVAHINKVQQSPLDGAKTSAKRRINATRKRKGSQLWMSSEHTGMQCMKNAEKEAAYKIPKRRASHPSVTRNVNDEGVSPLFQTPPAAHVEIPTPYYALPHKVNPVHWGMVGNVDLNWNAPNLIRPTSHAQSEIRSLLLSKRRVTSSHSDQKTSLANIQNVQGIRDKQCPSTLAPQSTLQGDSCVKHPMTVKHQLSSTTPHCPVTSSEVNHFTVAMTQPYTLPHFSPNATAIPPSPLSGQSLPNTLTHIPVPSTTGGFNYPYFLLNGQTYTTGSTVDIYPNTRYYPNAI